MASGETPFTHAFAIAPSNTADLPNVIRQLYVGVGGNVRIDTLQGETVDFIGVLAGTLYDIQAKKVWSTGTTATNMVGIY